ncbi:xanthine dehydrogenase family protein molybdopterin-binding subunit [Falsiroseomonas selenitidurans]|uniref:Xanthine dehydrogenase family protein molybdopterin-binding subunit n=1 Tax=Falsiroseomonas selenitidurans TaxID=2716335 RepID=A0ABX1E9F8_9PROT|nr:xanthine dehydrogenase family protein molybdopterin-binding subunit [Falsiroseomonas selenitidurans]NKC33869.1 xanthine dehydrogenase family protein molybdopterin-binding subunit [Falsiroseomonas selenitidurans]
MNEGLGSPMPRRDGRIKVTGAARFAADVKLPGLLHAALVTAPIARGRLVALDPAPALAVPGVARVLTAADMPRFAAVTTPPMATAVQPMQDDVIRFEGQPVAIVLAATPEAAEAGAARVAARYAADAPLLFSGERAEVPSRESFYVFEEPDLARGDVPAGLAAAAHRVAARYHQPPRHHNPMENSATLAVWEDGRLTLHTAAQWTYGVRYGLAGALGLAPERIRVLAAHTGGGFGAKGYTWPHQLLAAVAAQVTGRPVRLAYTRAQMYTMTGYQPEVAQEVTLGADAAGRLTAVRHASVSNTSLTDDYIEFAHAGSAGMYATPALQLSARMARTSLNIPMAMRAPHEGPGMFALESAMDEMAHALGMDPLDLRLANHADADPSDGRPWSSKKLREAYGEGAALFGWRERPRQAARDGHWILGTGMASCIMTVFRFPASARITLRADGQVVLEAGTQDIGTGTLTIFPQIAAGELGIPIERVTLRHGDTDLPETGGTFGSSSTACVGAAVQDAARKLRARLDGIAALQPASLGAPAEAPEALLRRAGLADLSAEGRYEFGRPFDAAGHAGSHAMRTFGAVFVEVAVDPELGLMRLRRAVGSYSVGRIVNPRTARSQMIGGITWGWGMAAMEASVVDPALGRFLSKNLSGVAIPVNADIPADIRIHFVDEVDPHAGPLGAKGIGEIGAVGVAAAVANAVFHATGRRIRDLPILPEGLLGAGAG